MQRVIGVLLQLVQPPREHAVHDGPHDGIAHHAQRADLFAGVLAGQISGLIMALVMMGVFAVFLGTSPLFPVQVIGSFVTGNIAVQGFHLPSVLWGLVLHQLGPSLAWGLGFGAVVHVLDVRRLGGLLLVGLGIGVTSQVIDVNMVIPVAFPALHGRDIWTENVPMFWSWAAHLVFGLSLATFGWVRPRIGDT